jgi:tetratricopeptide (TPR) repeat protein
MLPPRREAGEAFRALRTGGATMAALFLRDGDARKAVTGIERSGAGRIIDPDFFSLLRSVANDDAADDWRLLVRHFVTSSPEDELHSLDEDVLDAALWGVSLEAFRRDPSSLVIGHVLSRQLVRLGMPEAAPLVLNDALGADPSGASLSSATGFIASALSDTFDGGSSDTARRIFAASQAILDRADAKKRRARVDPSAAKLRLLMADIELRDGRAKAASALMRRALEQEPSVWGLTKLAKIERQIGEDAAALRHARDATALPAARLLPLDAIRARMLQFELLRDAKRTDEAAAALQTALDSLLKLNPRRLVPAGRIQRERLLARTLDSYGERKAALRAFARAMNLAARHRGTLPATALDLMSWGLARNELPAARGALHAMLTAGIEKDSLVYGALWLMLLEEKVGKKPGAKVERILLEAKDHEGWRGKLARWGRREMSDEDLMKSASDHAERVEARFYAGMRRHVRGEAQAVAVLRSVARDPLIDLLEVRIAREVSSPGDPMKLPAGRKLP